MSIGVISQIFLSLSKIQSLIFPLFNYQSYTNFSKNRHEIEVLWMKVYKLGNEQIKIPNELEQYVDILKGFKKIGWYKAIQIERDYRNSYSLDDFESQLNEIPRLTYANDSYGTLKRYDGIRHLLDHAVNICIKNEIYDYDIDRLLAESEQWKPFEDFQEAIEKLGEEISSINCECTEDIRERSRTAQNLTLMQGGGIGLSGALKGALTAAAVNAAAGVLYSAYKGIKDANSLSRAEEEKLDIYNSEVYLRKIQSAFLWGAEQFGRWFLVNVLNIYSVIEVVEDENFDIILKNIERGKLPPEKAKPFIIKQLKAHPTWSSSYSFMKYFTEDEVKTLKEISKKLDVNGISAKVEAYTEFYKIDTNKVSIETIEKSFDLDSESVTKIIEAHFSMDIPFNERTRNYAYVLVTQAAKQGHIYAVLLWLEYYFSHISDITNLLENASDTESGESYFYGKECLEYARESNLEVFEQVLLKEGQKDGPYRQRIINILIKSYEKNIFQSKDPETQYTKWLKIAKQHGSLNTRLDIYKRYINGLSMSLITRYVSVSDTKNLKKAIKSDAVLSEKLGTHVDYEKFDEFLLNNSMHENEKISHYINITKEIGIYGISADKKENKAAYANKLYKLYLLYSQGYSTKILNNKDKDFTIVTNYDVAFEYLELASQYESADANYILALQYLNIEEKSDLLQDCSLEEYTDLDLSEDLFEAIEALTKAVTLKNPDAIKLAQKLNQNCRIDFCSFDNIQRIKLADFIFEKLKDSQDEEETAPLQVGQGIILHFTIDEGIDFYNKVAQDGVEEIALKLYKYYHEEEEYNLAAQVLIPCIKDKNSLGLKLIYQSYDTTLDSDKDKKLVASLLTEYKDIAHYWEEGLKLYSENHTEAIKNLEKASHLHLPAYAMILGEKLLNSKDIQENKTDLVEKLYNLSDLFIVEAKYYLGINYFRNSTSPSDQKKASILLNDFMQSPSELLKIASIAGNTYLTLSKIFISPEYQSCYNSISPLDYDKSAINLCIKASNLNIKEAKDLLTQDSKYLEASKRIEEEKKQLELKEKEDEKKQYKSGCIGCLTWIIILYIISKLFF